jgi:hypothetical protein
MLPRAPLLPVVIHPKHVIDGAGQIFERAAVLGLDDLIELDGAKFLAQREHSPFYQAAFSSSSVPPAARWSSTHLGFDPLTAKKGWQSIAKRAVLCAT